MQCQTCGASLNTDALWCPECGSPVTTASAGHAVNATPPAAGDTVVLDAFDFACDSTADPVPTLERGEAIPEAEPEPLPLRYAGGGRFHTAPDGTNVSAPTRPVKTVNPKLLIGGIVAAALVGIIGVGAYVINLDKPEPAQQPTTVSTSSSTDQQASASFRYGGSIATLGQTSSDDGTTLRLAYDSITVGVVFLEGHQDSSLMPADDSRYRQYTLGTVNYQGKDTRVLMREYYVEDGTGALATRTSTDTYNLACARYLNTSGQSLAQSIRLQDSGTWKNAAPLVSDDLTAADGSNHGTVWCVWIDTAMKLDKAEDQTANLATAGYDGCLFENAAWTGITSASAYSISAGTYANQKQAEDAVEALKSRYPNAVAEPAGQPR